MGDKMIVVKVLSFSKKKQRRITDAELDAFEKRLRSSDDSLRNIVRPAELLAAQDFVFANAARANA